MAGCKLKGAHIYVCACVHAYGEADCVAVVGYYRCNMHDNISTNVARNGEILKKL